MPLDHLVVLCPSPFNCQGVFDECTADGLYLGGDVRMEAACTLYRTGAAEHIIVVGGGIHETDDDKKWRKVRDMSHFLISNGIPRSNITGVASEADTLGNLRALYVTLAQQLKGSRIGLLTNFYHLPRAMRIATDAQFDWQATFIPLCAEAFTPRALFPPLDALQRRIIKETHGLQDWEQGTYTVQHLCRKEWAGEQYHHP